jgi:periplasmic protein TonB
MSHPATIVLLVLALAGCASSPPERQSDAANASASASREAALAQARLNDAKLTAELAELESRVGSAQLTLTKLPRKQFVTTNTAGVYLSYVQECVVKIADYVNAHYPDEARGRLYGKGIASFEVDVAGHVTTAEMDKSTGHALLDRTFLNAIRASSPFPPLPAAAGHAIDILSITTPFSFDHVDDE